MAKKEKQKASQGRKSENLPFAFDAKPWDWLLGFTSDLSRDVFLDGLMGLNPLVATDERRRLIAAIHLSQSLDTEEKRRVIRAFPTLSRFQIDALFETFAEEQSKFVELKEEHPDDIQKLNLKRELEWSEVIDAKYGVARILAEIPLDKLGMEEIRQGIARLFREARRSNNRHAVLRMSEYIIQYAQKASVKIDNDFINYILSEYIQTNVAFLQLENDDFEEKIKHILKTLDDLSSKKSKEHNNRLLYLYLCQRYGHIKYFAKEIDEAISQFSINTSLFVIFLSVYKSDAVSFNKLLEVFRFGASKPDIFDATIEKNIKALSDERLASYMLFCAFVACVFFVNTAKNLTRETTRLGLEFNRVYGVIKSEISRRSHTFHLLHLDEINSLLFFFGERETRLFEREYPKGDSFSIIEATANYGLDVKKLSEVIASDKQLDKSSIYLACLLAYTVSLKDKSVEDWAIFREVQEKTIILFEELHRLFQLPYDEVELSAFHEKLAPPRIEKGSLSELMRAMREMSDGKED